MPDPSPTSSSPLDALLRLIPLARLPRTGWIQHGVPEPESVAAHTTGVGLVVLALAPRVEPPLDVGRALALALVHDAPEALTGDLPRPGSRLLPAGAKRSAERAAADLLLGPLSDAAREAYDELEALETREARLVKLCDQLQLGVQLLAYLRAGSRGLDDFVEVVETLDCSEFPPAAELRRELLEALSKLA